jgi:hypothetical protein
MSSPCPQPRRISCVRRCLSLREKVVGLCARAWSVIHRLHPDLFNRDIPNPWRGVTKKRRTKAIKPAATREQVYAFANAAISAGYPEAGAVAVICFEWLQRPENVLAGYIRWADYRGREAPKAIRIFHHKTGAIVLHPLEDDDGTLFYADAESILAKLPRRGIPMILHETRDKTAEGNPGPPSSTLQVVWKNSYAVFVTKPDYRRRLPWTHAGTVE